MAWWRNRLGLVVVVACPVGSVTVVALAAAPEPVAARAMTQPATAAVSMGILRLGVFLLSKMTLRSGTWGARLPPRAHAGRQREWRFRQWRAHVSRGQGDGSRWQPHARWVLAIHHHAKIQPKSYP